MNPLLTEDQRSPEPWASLAENPCESEAQNVRRF
jgi:hypothetical protein